MEHAVGTSNRSHEAGSKWLTTVVNQWSISLGLSKNVQPLVVNHGAHSNLLMVVHVHVMYHSENASRAMSLEAIDRQSVPGNLKDEKPFTFKCSHNFLWNRKPLFDNVLIMLLKWSFSILQLVAM